MAVITAEKFAQATTEKSARIRLTLDQKIGGLSLKAGDICDRPASEANYLVALERAERVKPGEDSVAKPVAATR